MQIIWCLGGLGNQMFQYAFYRCLQLENKDVALDLSEFKNYSLHNGFELTKIFSININEPDYSLVDEIKKAAASTSIWSKIYRKLKLPTRYIVQNNFNYNPKYCNFANTQTKYLEGYWQSEKYFSDYADVIRNDFTFPDIDNYNELYVTKIQQTNAVSVHIRMGDYVNHPLHGEICTLEYYTQAIEIIKSKIANPMYFVFSNDIEWCKQNLEMSNAVYVTGNVDGNSYRDMQLMSMCKHNVIANSSFSWWGAWLNNNPNKVVIAPSKWFNDESINTCDLLPESWIKI